MAERRRQKRYPRRFQVRFGERDFSGTGFTVDVSLSGIFIVTVQQLPPLDTRLVVQVVGDDRTPSQFLVGVVQRHRLVPPELRQVSRSGFGLRLLRPDELMRPLLPATAGKETAPLEIVFGTPAEFKTTWEAELRHGGLFVRTSAAMKANTEVKVVVMLTYANTNLEFDCRVVHVSGADSGPKSVSLLFTNVSAAREALAPFVI